MDDKNNIDPFTLISLNFHSSKKTYWYLLKVRVKKYPKWVKEVKTDLTNSFCIFREIVYVDNNNEFIGFGRSYMPINFFGISLFFKCISPLHPKPLGVVLKDKYPEKFKILVVKNEKEDNVKCPFRNDTVKTISFDRIITINNIENTTKCCDISKTIFVEENFIENTP